MKPQTLFYLVDASHADPELLQDIEDHLSAIFQSFCQEHFSFHEALDYPALRLIPATTPEALAQQLFHVQTPHPELTPEAAACCLFLCDDEINGIPLFECTIHGTPIAIWLQRFFPAIPKVLITHPGHAKCQLPTRRWSQKSFTILSAAPRHRERLLHLFASFWLPQFWDALRRYVRRHAGISWHTPGHNNGHAFRHSPFLHGFYSAFSPMLFRADLSVSVTSLGDLSEPEGHTPLTMAQRIASEIFGSAQTSFVTNGTSTSNKAMLMTLLRPGETVLLDRNCHKSVHHAVVMSGAVPRYLPAHYNATLGIWTPIALETLQAELQYATTLPEAQQPKLLVITTCTYEGILYPVWEIAKACEAAGILFYADEAWAPYLGFHPYYTYPLADGTVARYNAVSESGGAHVAVQSTHKALAAFSQASMIHVSTRFRYLLEEDRNRRFKWLRKRFHLNGHGSYEKFSHDLHEVLRYWHSTSPHYPILATLDFAGIQMRLEGLQLLDERLRWVAAFRQRIATLTGLPESACFADLGAITGDERSWLAKGYLHDPLKLTLIFRSEKACAACQRLLHDAHLQWEKASPVTILFLVTAGTRQEHFDLLYRCLRKVKADIGLPEQVTDAALLTEAVNVQPDVLPRDAALCDGELLPLEACEGRIASQLIVPYPPGIPVLIPGLRITKAMILLIRTILKQAGAEAVHGLFIRGKKVMIEVLNQDEEAHVYHLTPSQRP